MFDKYLRIGQGRITDFASMFPEKGFTCMESDLSMPEGIVTDSEALMHHFESRMLYTPILNQSHILSFRTVK
jgi:hypothetical protein